MSDLASYSYIHEGPWTNWSHGLIFGKTLTLGRQNGTFLLVFLAIYVTVAATCAWQIVTFILHQALNTAPGGVSDELHAQRQAVLRNTRTAAGALWDLFHLGLSWRGKTKSPLTRTIPFGLLALLHLALFGVSSIFVSKVARNSSDPVLIRSPNCGYADFPRVENTDWEFKNLMATTRAADYVQSCYYDSGAERDCNSFVQKKIQWEMTNNVSCPFDPKICAWTSTSAIRLDTGPIDSNSILGINAAVEDRVTMRRVTTCSPLRLTAERFTRETPDFGYGGPEEVFKVDIGPLGKGFNYTHEYNMRAVLVVWSYLVEGFIARAGLGGGWNPIPELNRTDADVSAIFLTSNGVYYNNPVDDPVFSAHRQPNETTEEPLYYPDHSVAAIACTDQFQFCEVSDSPTKRCTNLTSSFAVENEVKWLFPSDMTVRIATAGRLAFATRDLNMDAAIRGRGSSAIRASRTVSYRLQTAQLPNDQWKLEISGWFSIGLATLQKDVVTFALGTYDLRTTGKLLRTPTNTSTYYLCLNQMIPNPGTHQNFSTVGIVVVLVLGGLLMFLGVTIDPIIGWVQARYHMGEHRRLGWINDAFLQLQKQARGANGNVEYLGMVENRGKVRAVADFSTENTVLYSDQDRY